MGGLDRTSTFRGGLLGEGATFFGGGGGGVANYKKKKKNKI